MLIGFFVIISGVSLLFQYNLVQRRLAKTILLNANIHGSNELSSTRDRSVDSDNILMHSIGQDLFGSIVNRKDLPVQYRINDSFTTHLDSRDLDTNMNRMTELQFDLSSNPHSLDTTSPMEIRDRLI